MYLTATGFRDGSRFNLSPTLRFYKWLLTRCLLEGVCFKEALVSTISSFQQLRVLNLLTLLVVLTNKQCRGM